MGCFDGMAADGKIERTARGKWGRVAGKGCEWCSILYQLGFHQRVMHISSNEVPTQNQLTIGEITHKLIYMLKLFIFITTITPNAYQPWSLGLSRYNQPDFPNKKRKRKKQNNSNHLKNSLIVTNLVEISLLWFASLICFCYQTSWLISSFRWLKREVANGLHLNYN